MKLRGKILSTYLKILVLLELMCKLIEQPFDLVVLGSQLGPVQGLEVVHFLSQICDLLVQGKVGVLEVGHLADQGRDPRFALLELLVRGGVGAALLAQLSLELLDAVFVEFLEVLAALLHLLVVHLPQLLEGLLEPVLVLFLQLAVHFGDFNLLAMLHFGQLLLQKLELELEIFLEPCACVFEVGRLQLLVIQLALGLR